MESNYSRRPVGGLTFRDLRHEDPSLLRTLYRTVLKPSFPADELEPLPVMEAAISGDGSGAKARAIVAVQKRDQALGGIISYWYPRSGVLLLGYLAVRPDARRQGIGTMLMEHAAQSWFHDPECLLAVAEVEDPRHFPKEASEARLALYGRLGARILKAPYFQPRVAPGVPRVFHMLLLVFHAQSSIRRGGDLDSHAIKSRVVTAFLTEYFEEAEGAGAVASDVDIRRLLSFYKGLRLIPLLDPKNYEKVPDLAQRNGH